jgi:hypothetical protein
MTAWLPGQEYEGCAEDIVTAIVRPYVMTPDEWNQALLRSTRWGLLRRILAGLRGCVR